VSIKRRVRMLGGEMMLDSRPGHGSSLEIRVPL
jgi:signal transduction histidine kinase